MLWVKFSMLKNCKKRKKSCVRSGKQVGWVGLRVERCVGKLAAVPSMYKGRFVGRIWRMAREIGNERSIR